MYVKIINDKAQSFKGRRYYLCGFYFQRDGKRLHIAVWEHFNGKVPQGMHIHHKDGNRANNQIENLELLPGGKHLSYHNKGRSKDFPIEARIAAAKWHGSPEGIEWHKKHYEEFQHKLHEPGEFICEYCGQKYITEIKGNNRFCSNNCKTRWRWHSGIDNVERICTECGRSFIVNKYVKKKTCSPKCATKSISRTKRGQKPRILP